MLTDEAREELASSAADPMTMTLRLKRAAFCPACGIGLSPLAVRWLNGYAFCHLCGDNSGMLPQAAIKHMQTHALATYVIYTDGLAWFSPPIENHRGHTVFTCLDIILGQLPSPREIPGANA